MIRYQFLTAEKDGKTQLQHGMPITSTVIDYFKLLKDNQKQNPDYTIAIAIMDVEGTNFEECIDSIKDGNYKVVRVATLIKNEDFPIRRSTTLQ